MIPPQSNTPIHQLTKASGIQKEANYPPEEGALIKLAAEDILNLEQKKAYHDIYDRYASKLFQKHLPKRLFIARTLCVETYLGNISVYHLDQSVLGPKKTPDGHLTDRMLLPVIRSHGQVVERLSFVREGAGYKLFSIKWLSKKALEHPSYVACMKETESGSILAEELETDTVVEMEAETIEKEKPTSGNKKS